MDNGNYLWREDDYYYYYYYFCVPISHKTCYLYRNKVYEGFLCIYEKWKSVRTRYARKKYSTTMNHHAYFYLCPTFFRSDDDDENVKFASVRSI